MAHNLVSLREELSMFLSTKYDEGLLDRGDFEHFRRLHNAEDHKRKGFSTAADLLTVIYKDGEQMIREIYQLYAKPVINIVKIGELVHRIHSNSRSCGSIKIIEACNALKEARDKSNTVGCRNAMDQISREFQRMIPVYVNIIKLERRIYNLIIAQPSTKVLSRASPSAISLPRASTSGIPRVPPPPIADRRKSSMPQQTNDRRRV